MIGEKFNFEDVFFRDLTACVLDTLEGQVRWVNRFSSGNVFVQVPFYYSLTGDERFLLDTFADDIVSENRFVELNTDMIPRGHLTMTGFNINSDDFANPNVWLRMVVENEVEIRKVLAKVRAIPITVNYDLEILLSNEIDTFKCSQAIMDTMWLYKFMYFEHNFLNIDAVILMPDTNSIEMVREKNLTSDNTIKLKVSFEVQTYYPAFRKDRYNSRSYPRTAGDGMVDVDGHTQFSGSLNNEDDFYNEYYPDRNPETFAGGNPGGAPFPRTSPSDFVGGGSQPIIQGGQIPAGVPGSGNSTPGLNSGIGGPSNPYGPGGSGRPVSYAGGGSGSNSTNGGVPDWGPAGSGRPIDYSGPGGPQWPRDINPSPFGPGSGGPDRPPAGYTQGFFSNASAVGGTDPFGTTARLFFNDPDYFIVSPKRTRWFNNILRARERSAIIPPNPNGEFGPNSNEGNPNN